MSACVISTDDEYTDIHSDHYNTAVARYRTIQTVTMECSMKPIEGYTFFKVTDFTKEEEE